MNVSTAYSGKLQTETELDGTLLLSKTDINSKVQTTWTRQDANIRTPLSVTSGDRDSSVGIATRYGLDDPGVESRWGARFTTPVQTGPGAHPAYCTMGSGSFPVVKRPGRGVGHPPPSSVEVKERVELYLYSPLGLLGLF